MSSKLVLSWSLLSYYRVAKKKMPVSLNYKKKLFLIFWWMKGRKTIKKKTALYVLVIGRFFFMGNPVAYWVQSEYTFCISFAHAPTNLEHDQTIQGSVFKKTWLRSREVFIFSMYRVFRKNCVFFNIHCIPYLACISLQESWQNNWNSENTFFP